MKDILIAFANMLKEKPGILYAVLAFIALALGLANITELADAAARFLAALRGNPAP